MYRIFLRIALLLLISAKTYSQCSSVNVATGVAFATKGIAGHDSSKAFDSDLSSYYSEGSSTQEIGIDMGRDVAICSVELTWGSADYATGYVVRASSDWSNWTTLPTKPHSLSGTDTFYFPNPLTTYRIVEIYVYGRAPGSSAIRLYNFAVHEAASGNNLPPVVNLTGPVNNAKYQLGNAINISATASDPNGGLLRVEYYKEDTLLGDIAYPGPYNFAWTPTVARTYSVKVKAIDNLGASTTSAPVSVVVGASAVGSWALSGNGGTNPATQFIGTTDAQALIFKTNNTGQLSIGADGKVKIGSFASPPPDAKLAVDGFIYARKLTVTTNSWADYVFAPSYKLLPLKDVESYIQKNRHLPGVVSAATVAKNGVDLGENQAVLLKKVEELTLYIIQLNKEIEQLKQAKLK